MLILRWFIININNISYTHILNCSLNISPRNELVGCRIEYCNICSNSISYFLVLVLGAAGPVLNGMLRVIYYFTYY